MTFYDLAYAVGIGATAPVWMWVPKYRRKILDAVASRTGAGAATGNVDAPTILIHAVSMGEINATTALVGQLAASSANARFIISTTSRTGEDRARQLYEKNPCVTRIRYPFDFSSSVERMLDAQKPKIAVLMELEVWPNFMLACANRNIPVVLINGRLSAHSFRGYRLLAPITRRMFGRLTMACVQDDAYAGRFSRVGVPADRIRVTGTMKFDTASVADSVDGAADIAASVRLRPGEEKIWVCGSTGPGEEKIAIGVYARLRKKFPRLRLVLVPRHPERFDEVANLIRSAGFDAIRRSVARADLRAASTARADAIVLGDTMGELRKFYSMADAVFVGRSLVDLGAKQHGSDMIEAAALAKPVIVGRHTGNFADVMDRFREAGAIREVADAEGLETEVEGLLTSPLDAADLGRRGQEVVSQNQGATQRHVGVILEYLRRSQDR